MGLRRDVSAFGLDAGDEQVIRSVLALYLTHAGWRWIGGNTERADLIFVDLDNIHAEHKLPQVTGRFVIGVSNRARPDIPSVNFYLEKPLRYARVLRSIRDIDERAGSTSASPGRPDSCRGALSRGPFRPDATLLGLITDGWREHRTFLIKPQNGPEVLIDGPAARYFVEDDGSDEDVAEIDPLKSSNVVREINGPSGYSGRLRSRGHLNRLIFKIALVRSRGRLWEGVTANTPFMLRRWPDLVYTGSSAIHVRLASYLVNRVATIPRAASATGVDDSAVVAFHNACRALGLVDYEVSDSPTGHSDMSVVTRHQTVYAGIRERLAAWLSKS